MGILYTESMFFLRCRGVERYVLHFFFWGCMVPKPGRGGWLTQSLPVPEPAPTSLEQNCSESGLGVRCGWLSKLSNAVVITLYCCVHLTFQIHPSWVTWVLVIPPLGYSYLSLTANLTLALFLQKHLTLCKNLAWTSLRPLPNKSSAGLRSLAWAGSASDCCPPAQGSSWYNSGPLFWAKGQWLLFARRPCPTFCFKMVLPAMWTGPISSFGW